ncbi:hypothetical protein PV05_02247 [Exophiala xenobiotica]|uniref:Uncharacterized protein n=1 Tax=Exophiala xenobiotica TaxID=348802 RepID=A0A0D2BZ06_9EURO|nr:uncharacterized protein PV05_02247 [Exophiala xenobiotica]KIW57681.1 hypothetical protein PV05_02247 [Exophiala xenobiotica]
MPRTSKRRKTSSGAAAAPAEPAPPPDEKSLPKHHLDDSTTTNEAKQETVRPEASETGTHEHIASHPEADEANAEADNISNASDAPTFDDIDPADADPALLDEEEAPKSTSATKGASAVGVRGGFNALKSFHGQVYSGMAIGGSHTWNYDQGAWKETKLEPDLWKIDYETTKRRARNAPRGSGAPVGTEYHWLIVAHQHVKKIDANTYTTHLTGSKYKLAHKNVNSNSWSVPTVKVQREREVDLLEDAKRRVQGLPPVLAGEKVKVEKGAEKGQRKLETMFGKKADGGEKRKREDDG